MISDWLSESGQKAWAVLPVEWEEAGFSYRLHRSSVHESWAIRRIDGDRWAYDHHITDHEALCLLRDWAREWLGKAGVTFKSYGGTTKYYYYDGGMVSEDYLDYDAALIAAVLAVGEKK